MDKDMEPKVKKKQREDGRENASSQIRRQKQQKHFFIYGNYHRYYGYRIGQALDEDPRLKVLKKEWFEGKDCLDIGCNEGFITISIAQKFSCRTMLGTDIDDSLIGKARRHLKRIAAVDEDHETGVQPSEDKERENELEGVDSRSFGGEARGLLRNSDSDNGEGRSKGAELLKRVRFRTENFIEKFHSESDATYDTVLCLSVTKWVHLNWGDEGLIRLFAKIWQVLRLGGILVLEPQPWISYEKKRLVSEVAVNNFNNIIYRPDVFQEILLDKIGFRSMEKISARIPNSTAGFNRPIYLLQK
eukprot:Gb_07471 [translate_table: standard]